MTMTLTLTSLFLCILTLLYTDKKLGIKTWRVAGVASSKSN